ncbi:patatin-like phospholipase family protein [Methylosinus sporium]|uniref:Patatin-like phospholipase family protein n=1 Tax=Methylosinus sporium TaxID=428 RepID=A0A549SL29_METSR|nr:patatin-like phospholipase family protein [Methylosinus sporium]MBU3890505.1 patatin-like phospholipase family protein [Methylosinus sp. KRF6]TRL30328.1 patatin-like phospholipase family protein [Methylosinus sporium]
MSEFPFSVAVALGGGGARGLAHIAVLETLDELGVRPCAIAGASIGAIIGAAYAAGFSGAELRAHAEATFRNRVRLARRLLRSRARRRGRTFSDLAHPALIDAERFLDSFWPQGMPQTFEELQIPFIAVATDFRLRRAAAISSGPLRPAVGGSMAIPGLVRPVAYGDSYLIDGGLVDPLPYDHLAGRADIVLAVDVSGAASGRPRNRPPSPIETIVVASQIMMNAISERMIEESPPDVLISPAVNQYLALDLFKAKRIFEAGDACRAQVIEGLQSAAARLSLQRRA